MLQLEEWGMIRHLKNQGLSISEISRKLSFDRKTVRKALQQDKLEKYKRVSKEDTKLEAHKKFIQQRLELYNLTASKIHREISLQGYLGKYGMVSKYVKSLKAENYIKAVQRFETLPGEQSQVDWGYFGDFYDYEQKRVIRLCCFLMILGYSRTRFIHFFDGDDTDNFLMGHNLAIEYFGGITREVLYDNLKSVVIKRAFKQKESEFNKKFLEFSSYYGFKIVLARPYRPQTKGKVENTVRYVRNDFFNGEEFTSLNDVNNRARLWIDRVNQEIHHTTHQRPIERLKIEDLIKPNRLYDLSKIYYRKVFNDCHFSFRGNFYSLSPEYACKEVSIKEINSSEIIVYYRANPVGKHKLNTEVKGLYITQEEHKDKILKIQFNTNVQRNKKAPFKKQIQQQEALQNFTNFNSNKIIQIYERVEQHDLNLYQEVL